MPGFRVKACGVCRLYVCLIVGCISGGQTVAGYVYLFFIKILVSFNIFIYNFCVYKV